MLTPVFSRTAAASLSEVISFKKLAPLSTAKRGASTQKDAAVREMREGRVSLEACVTSVMGGVSNSFKLFRRYESFFKAQGTFFVLLVYSLFAAELEVPEQPGGMEIIPTYLSWV